jgi:hypothetical protein
MIDHIIAAVAVGIIPCLFGTFIAIYVKTLTAHFV